MTKDLPLIHKLTREDFRLAKMLKALGNPVRFRILEYLTENQMGITGDIVVFASLRNQRLAGISKSCAKQVYYKVKSRDR